MKKALKIIMPLTSVVLLQACASITTGPNQSVSVNTAEVQGAKCQLSNDKGTWYVQTPGSVTVNRAYGDLAVNCQKDDLHGNLVVASKTKGMAFGNIIAGGVVGAVADVATGSAYDYPNQITVPLSHSVPTSTKKK